MARWHEFSFYSPLLDADACRLSMFDQHGGEFFMIVPLEDGRPWRSKRDKALDAIEWAISHGLQPGEVRVQ